MKRVGTSGIALAVLGASVSRVLVDIAVEEERMRQMADLFANDPPAPAPVAADYSSLEVRVAAHTLSAPFDESTQIKNPQADAYASVADLISPLPDRLSVNPDSPFYGEYGKIGVRFAGKDRPGDVEEYCVSEGWIRVRTFMNNGKPKKERGKFVCLKKFGKVEPYRK